MTFDLRDVVFQELNAAAREFGYDMTHEPVDQVVSDLMVVCEGCAEMDEGEVAEYVREWQEARKG